MAKHGACKGPLILPRPSNSGPTSFSSMPSSSSSSVIGRSKALIVHSQAEKRRRERINEHLSTLRRMFPDARKMDKATLLGRVIDHVKDLKKKAIDIGKGFSIPAEANEVIIEAIESEDTTTSNKINNNFYIKATICCDDRPDLFMNVVKALHGLRLGTIRAEITSIGGRVKNVFILCGKDSSAGVCMESLMENIKDVLARIASFDVAEMDGSSTKRQRLLQSYCSSVPI